MSNGYTPDSPEEWRPVPGASPYEVSSHGRVRSVFKGTPRVLNPSPNSRGYLTFLVCMGSRTAKYTKFVHHAVAEAFHGPRPEGRVIRHLDGDQLNNLPENLAYGTQSENIQDAVRQGSHPMTRRTHCPRGHEYNEENTSYSFDRRKRQCRPCAAARMRDMRAAA